MATARLLCIDVRAESGTRGLAVRPNGGGSGTTLSTATRKRKSPLNDTGAECVYMLIPYGTSSGPLNKLVCWYQSS